ncbi:alkene reductase [Thioalkalivibrio sp. XN279]|uniref:alkene reductase n=1 Tax=Thioalkalivibrio sp. XN279 TaxID=2714953 RepID=UPI0014095C60|nr:alkene reductase [Thioalkalivibrio sp. XN279]NHA14190.1 alkene reductase [Thioalkalivibrio sp. XN279]
MNRADHPLFQPCHLGPLALQNRIVLAPLTRSRAEGNVPNALMAEYYGQRNSAGLLITEGTSPSPNGLGYPRIPGIFSAAQVEGWRAVTAAVHAGGAKIFMQLMHTGRIGHAHNLPEGARVLAPSAVAANGQMYTDQAGLQPHPVPEAMTAADIAAAEAEFVQGAQNAIAAGFDGIELHGANGYLLEQFFRPTSNQRTDQYGGSFADRARFVLEVAERASAAIGNERVGIRLSPFGVFNDMPHYDAMAEDYTELAGELGKLGLAYLHIADHSASGAPEVPEAVKQAMAEKFGGPVIRCGGYTAERAMADIDAGKADLIAVGRDFLANPDLPRRWREGLELNAPDPETFYTPGPKGYTDYPVAG